MAKKTTPKLKLEVPNVVAPVETTQAAGLVPIKAEEQVQLDKKVEDFLTDLFNEDTNSPEFGKKVDQLTTMGRKEIAAASRQSNRFLDKPIREMEEDSVGQDLAELRRVVEDLDPGKKKDSIFSRRKLFGVIPFFGTRLNSYFNSYQSSQTHISEILSRMASGKDELMMDNAAIDVERVKLWEAMGSLEQMVYISKQMDERIENKIDDLEMDDPQKAKVLKETALFYIRQRQQDLLTQMAVSVQGYLALDMVKKNNIELVKGVDRASTTTVNALRTAVTTAQALSSQKLVLNQITALNETTGDIIESTGRMLRENTGRIHEQAASATVSVEVLQRAFQNIYDTMDEVEGFKLKALENMKQTVTALSGEVAKSEGYIARAEGQAQAKLSSRPNMESDFSLN